MSLLNPNNQTPTSRRPNNYTSRHSSLASATNSQHEMNPRQWQPSADRDMSSRQSLQVLRFYAQSRLNQATSRVDRDLRIILGHASMLEKVEVALDDMAIQTTTHDSASAATFDLYEKIVEKKENSQSKELDTAIPSWEPEIVVLTKEIGETDDNDDEDAEEDLLDDFDSDSSSTLSRSSSSASSDDDDDDVDEGDGDSGFEDDEDNQEEVDATYKLARTASYQLQYKAFIEGLSRSRIRTVDRVRATMIRI